MNVLRVKNRSTMLARVLLLAFATLFCPCGPHAAADTGYLAETPSDYADMANWLAAPSDRKYQVDVFFLYPTAYIPASPDAPLYCEIDDAGMRSGAPGTLKKQASAFETCADIYAPFYRQCDAMALAGMTQQEMLAVQSGVPRIDVFAALDYYFEHWNDGRPFILAGHSQGSMMIMIVLQEYMAAHPERHQRMIAAYMIGNAPTSDWLAANPHVKLASGAGDIGVVVSWNTEGPGNIGVYNMVVPKGSLCINPLNWRTDGVLSGISENKGSLVQNASGDYVVTAGFADARIEPNRGSVICTTVDPAEYATPSSMASLFGTESYHGWDYGFYYMNIRENAELRTKNFLAFRNAGKSTGCSAGLHLLSLATAAALIMLTSRYGSCSDPLSDEKSNHIRS